MESARWTPSLPEGRRIKPAPATNYVSPLIFAGDMMKKKPLFRGFFYTWRLRRRYSAIFTGDIVATKDRQLEEMLEPTVEAMGFALWGIEYVSQGRHSVMRIYIERDSGITADDCAAVSTQVSAVLDVEDPISGEYTLEVSSPGMDRRLFSLEQYRAYVGEVVDLQLRSPFDGRRKFKGVLTGIEGGDVVVRVDDHEFLLPHDGIDKARIEPRV